MPKQGSKFTVASDPRVWGSGKHVMVMGAAARGLLHASVVVTTEGHYFVRGSRYLSGHPCEGGGINGCVSAMHVREFMDALQRMRRAEHITLLANTTHGLALMRQWRDGSTTDSPSWYKDRPGSSFERAMHELRSQPGRYTIQPRATTDLERRLVWAIGPLAAAAIHFMSNRQLDRDYVQQKIKEHLGPIFPEKVN